MLERAKSYAVFHQKLRTFFESKGYLEIFTPAVVPVGAFEAVIDPLTVVWRGGRAELQTSPEIAMKGFLAEVRVPVFQICKSFRDDPPTPHHRREFTMLEFYAPDENASAMEALTKELILSLSGTRLNFREATVSELCLEHTGIDLSLCLTPDTLKAAMKAIHCTGFKGDEPWDDLFFRLWIERVENNLDHDVPTVVRDYPTAISPLSAPAKAQGFAERFEIYWKGMEICNGCTELADSAALKKRYEDESQSRRRAGKPTHPYPQDLVEASPKIGKCAGVAVGVERLFSCVTGLPPWPEPRSAD